MSKDRSTMFTHSSREWRHRSHLDQQVQSRKCELRRHPSSKRYPKVSNMIHSDQYFSFTFWCAIWPYWVCMTLDYRQKPTLHEFFNILFRVLQCDIWQYRISKTPIAKFKSPTGKFSEFETLVDNFRRMRWLFIFRKQPRQKPNITPNQNWTMIGVTATWKTDPKVFNAMDRIGKKKNRI